MYFKLAKFFCKIYYNIFFRMSVYGTQNVPADGAAIICANHISAYDIVTLALALNKLPSYLAKAELFESKNPFCMLLGWFLLKLDAIPVNRKKTDMKAYKTVLNKLKNGAQIGIFAHGTRMKDAAAADAKAGVAFFAVKSGAPVIPVAIISDYKLFGKIDVVFGEPIDFSEYAGKKVTSEELAEISVSIMEKVERLIITERAPEDG